MWDVLQGCRSQLRAASGGPYGLDFGAVMMMGAALGVDAEMLAEVLPATEAAILNAIHDEDGGE